MDGNLTWSIGKVCLTGAGHKVDETPCQDFCLSEVVHKPKESILISLVSDGAGSASLSHWGSNKACDSCMYVIRKWFSEHGDDEVTEEVIQQWLAQVHSEILEVAQGQKREARELACTLLGCVVKSDCAHFFQIGDGALVVLNEDEVYEPVFWPQNGEYANTTYFLTDENYAQNLRIQSRNQNIKKVAVFSDGLQNLLLVTHNRTAHQPFFHKIFGRLTQYQGSLEEFQGELERLFTSPMIQEKTDDDISLIVAQRDDNG